MTYKHTVIRPKRDPGRPVDEQLPQPDNTLSRPPMFQGRCYLCGNYCVGVFCRQHEWAGK